MCLLSLKKTISMTFKKYNIFYIFGATVNINVVPYFNHCAVCTKHNLQMNNSRKKFSSIFDIY